MNKELLSRFNVTQRIELERLGPVRVELGRPIADLSIVAAVVEKRAVVEHEHRLVVVRLRREQILPQRANRVLCLRQTAC